MSISYSDGDAIEKQILDVLVAAEDVSSNAWLGEQKFKSWPHRYHLSAERANIVRHLDFGGLDVLELGAGMGAVSRYLAERSKTLTVVEGTEARFRALSQRLSDLTNWQGHVSNIQEFETLKKFDVVCVIGVLEYSELYIKLTEQDKVAQRTPFNVFIEKARSLLKDDGVLVLAIENQLGLKYWNGASEDHTGGLFDGVVGYRSGPSPRTFSLGVLKGFFKEAGFEHFEDYFPFPDYKIPNVILSGRVIDEFPLFSAQLSTAQESEDYSKERLELFSEPLTAVEISKAGLLKEMSNSFLIVSSSSLASTVLARLLKKSREARAGAWYYNFKRQEGIVTEFGFNQKHEFESRKSVLQADAAVAAPKETIYQFEDFSVKHRGQITEHVIEGEKLSTKLERAIYFGEWSQFKADFVDFVRWSIARWHIEGSKNDQLNGEALDAIVLNVVMTRERRYHLFDLEWSWGASISIHWFIVRNLWACFSQFGRSRFLFPWADLAALYRLICAELSLESPDESLRKAIRDEACFQTLILKKGEFSQVEWQECVNRYLEAFEGIFFAKPGLKFFDRRLEAVPRLKAQFDAERSAKLHAEGAVVQLNAELATTHLRLQAVLGDLDLSRKLLQAPSVRVIRKIDAGIKRVRVLNWFFNWAFRIFERSLGKSQN